MLQCDSIHLILLINTISQCYAKQVLLINLLQNKSVLLWLIFANNRISFWCDCIEPSNLKAIKVWPSAILMNLLNVLLIKGRHTHLNQVIFFDRFSSHKQSIWLSIYRLRDIFAFIWFVGHWAFAYNCISNIGQCSIMNWCVTNFLIPYYFLYLFLQKSSSGKRCWNSV